MTAHADSAKQTVLVRLCWMIAALALTRVVVNIGFSAMTKILVSVAGDIDVDNLLGYNSFTLFLKYGIQIAMFVCLVIAAKHLPSSPTRVLFKTGSMVGVVGATLMVCVLIISTIYSYLGHMHADDPAFSEEGIMLLFLVIIGNPFTLTILPWVSTEGLALCVVHFFSHDAKIVRVLATALVVAIGALLLVTFLPMASRPAALLSAILQFVVNILTAALFAALAKSYKVTV